MRLKGRLASPAQVLLVLALTGCKPSNPNGGFLVSVIEQTQSANGQLSTPRPIPGVDVSGTFTGGFPNQTVYGTVGSYSGTEGIYSPEYEEGVPTQYQESLNYYWVVDGEAPGYYTNSFTLNYECGTTGLSYTNGSIWTYQFENVQVALTSGIQEGCLTSYLPSASTRFAVLGELPQTLTLAGAAPFTTVYGMPKLYVYNSAQTLVATETATSVSSGGANATFPFPSSLQESGYSVAVANQTSSSPGISTVGTNLLSIASSETVTGNPFGVSVGGITDAYIDENTCTTSEASAAASPDVTIGTITASGSTYSTVPVVSLYSLNEVYVGNIAIAVGANPTAVATYTGPDVLKTQTGDCYLDRNTYSGSTRAIVANSGSNTVSVLDMVNNALLYNVTVGSQPVALAVNTAGSAAYVANYQDSTVTKIDLTTGAAAGTVAVGGKPTSVALTAAGTLWVGGVGFLTEVNASTLAVVATETATGETIVALGYSDQVGRLAATTVDGSGNVYVDEVSPSSVKAGGTYTPAASTSVSSLGTHLNTESKADVKSFTGILASESIINTNQVGAPPLVVQDGWAVFTATPTGFTVSDISGNVVLFSEKTPSPVTAIAVDPSLNVAYLTMPDSNTILTVPLPGTGTN